MKAFIDDHRIVYGVEPICKVLPIAPSTYYLHAARKANPELRSARAKQDEALSQQIRRVWEESFQNYGARKVWIQLQREGWDVARCSVERLIPTGHKCESWDLKVSCVAKPSRPRSAMPTRPAPWIA